MRAFRDVRELLRLAVRFPCSEEQWGRGQFLAPLRNQHGSRLWVTSIPSRVLPDRLVAQANVLRSGALGVEELSPRPTTGACVWFVITSVMVFRVR